MDCLLLLSALFSNYDDIVYGGIIDRYEGVFVQLGYLLIAFFVFKIILPNVKTNLK